MSTQRSNSDGRSNRSNNSKKGKSNNGSNNNSNKSKASNDQGKKKDEPAKFYIGATAADGYNKVIKQLLAETSQKHVEQAYLLMNGEIREHKEPEIGLPKTTRAMIAAAATDPTGATGPTGTSSPV